MAFMALLGQALLVSGSIGDPVSSIESQLWELDCSR